MVVGQIGAHGRLVVNPAEQVFRNVLGAARSQSPNMAGKRATEICGKVVGATHGHAPVRTSSCKVSAIPYHLERLMAE